MKAAIVAYLFGVLAVSLTVAGCTRAHARTTPEPPPLDIPAPPPRNVEAVEPEPPLPATPLEEPRPTTPPTRPIARPAASQQKPEPAKPEPPRVEPTPVEPARPADDARGQPGGALQTTPAGREAQVEKNVRDLLSRAQANLNRVVYRGLGADARTQYDQALRFISQAHEALGVKNFVFASNLAEKAATLAAQLAGR